MDMRGYKHGLKGTPEYNAWVAMRQRCTNSTRPDWKYYGGRGITICPEWDSVEQFVADMGLRPSTNHQLDRRDNDNGYSKENCHWVEKTPQMRNTRISKLWFVNGVQYESLSDAAINLGVAINTIKKWCEGRSDGGYIYPPKPNCWSEKRYAYCV
jgi:hypothetical protein